MGTRDELAWHVNTPKLHGELAFHQGLVLTFNPDDGSNSVEVQGTALVDLPCLNVTDSVGLEPGMIVGILRVRSTYFILGRIATPGSSEFGDLSIKSASGAEINLGAGILSFRRGSLPDEAYGFMSATGAGDRVWLEITPPFTTGAQGDNKIFLEGRSSESPNGNMFLITSGDMHVSGEGELHLDAFGADAFLASSDRVQLLSGVNEVSMSHSTTTNAANAYLSATTSIIWRSTSSKKYKLDIEDLDVQPEAVLQLRARTWRDKGEVDKDSETTHRVPGFVAEEVADIPGMETFVIRDEDGDPEALAYDRMTAALLVLVQAQQEQIKELTARVAKLEAKG